MRNFFNSHWKAILAILIAIVLAMLTIDTRSSEPPLSRRLQAHTHVMMPDTPRSTLRHVETSLMRYGYAPQLEQTGDARQAPRSIEASRANVAPGAQPSRVFIVGAHLGRRDDAAGAAAMLELARAVRHLKPSQGTEIRFVFFMDDANDGIAVAGQRGAGNFMAYVGTRESSQRVRQVLAALRSDPLLARQGLAAPAHAMGLTLSGHGSRDGGPALVMTDTGFLRYPYFRTGPVNERGSGQAQDQYDYDGMARVVDGLARTLASLAATVEA